jgi:hypothetical protein
MNQSFWSKPRAPLLLGAAACVACCAVPISAIIIGAGAATARAAMLEPVAGVLFAAGAILAIAIVARRRSASRTACAVDERSGSLDGAGSQALRGIDGACGCGPSATRTDRTIFRTGAAKEDAPIACTADLGQKQTIQWHMDEYRAAFAHLARAERTADGCRWHFRVVPGLAERVRGLAEREHACCSFLQFEVRARGDEVVWETRAGKDASTFIDEFFFTLPERLREEQRPGHDLVHLEKRAREAGVDFTAARAR